MLSLRSLLPAFVRRFVFGDETPPTQVQEQVLACLRTNVSSPQLMSADLGHSVSDIDTACGALERAGKIRRSSDQIGNAVIVDDDGRRHIPSPYVRYELASP